MNFSIQKSFKESWKMFFSKKLYGPFVAASLVVIVAIYGLLGLSGLAGSALLLRGMWIPLGIVGIIFIFFISYLVLVSIKLPLITHETGGVDIKKTFTSMWNPKLIVKAGALMIFLGIVILLGGYLLSLLGGLIHPLFGVFLFIVWSGFVAIRFAFSLYLLADSHSNLVPVLKISHQMMKGNGWKFLVFIVAIGVISLVVQAIFVFSGVIHPLAPEILSIAFGVFIVPWFSLLSVSPYLQIKNK